MAKKYHMTLTSVFNNFDKSVDNMIDIGEMRRGLYAAIKVRLTDAQARTVFDHCDADRSGEIDLGELSKAFRRPREGELGTPVPIGGVQYGGAGGPSTAVRRSGFGPRPGRRPPSFESRRDGREVVFDALGAVHATRAGRARDLREVVAAGRGAAADGEAEEAARWKRVEMRLRKEATRGEAHILRLVEDYGPKIPLVKTQGELEGVAPDRDRTAEAMFLASQARKSEANEEERLQVSLYVCCGGTPAGIVRRRGAFC